MTPPELEFGAPSELIGEPDIARCSDRADAGPATQDEGVLVPAEAAAAAASSPVPCEFLCGVAGTGKTYSLRKAIEADPSWGMLCSTTGISAVNLGTTTLNSCLRFFDTDSLRDAYLRGTLATRLHDIGKEHARLCIDEVSMMDGLQLDLIYRATIDANAYADVRRPLGLTVVGDFAQLPPIRARWAFEADCWEHFAAHTTRLRKVWRQAEGGVFLAALGHARRGDGVSAASALTAAGAQWHTALDVDFDGTTIIPKNDAVDRYNGLALARLRGTLIAKASRRWGQLRGEWKNIPERLELKPGAYVMLLSNDPEFRYANGDCGHVAKFDDAAQTFVIRLVRNDAEVEVPILVRDVTMADAPAGWSGPKRPDKDQSYLPRAHTHKRRHVIGQVEYWPLRLAYASTVHKSQGISLDRVQVDFRDRFFAQPAMLYTALSRCRTLEGLRLVGQRERFVKHCNMERKVQQWL